MPVLVIENAGEDPVGPLGEWLVEAGAELDVRRPYDDPARLPATLDEHAGLLVLGGAMNAADDVIAPWLPHVRELLRAAVAREVPTLGICLGGQLLALANGGTVAPNPDGPEYGPSLVAKRAAAATDPLFGPMPITPDVLQWHQDAITALPPGAIQLASSPMCEQQAFRLGRLAWGVQFHIETTPDLVRRWAAETARAGDGSAENHDFDTIVARSDGVHADIAETWKPFAAAFAQIVRDPESVKPARPLRVSTAEPVTDPAAIRAALAQELHASRATLPSPALRPPDRE